MRATRWMLVFLMAIAMAGRNTAPAQEVRRADEKLPPELEGRGLLRPAERAAAGLDPYPHRRGAEGLDAATSATVATADSPTSVVLAQRALPPTLATNDRPTTPTMSREEVEARLKRNEALALAAVRDPRVRQRAELVVDKRFPGPWSLEYRRRLVEAEVRRLIRIGTDLKTAEDIKKAGVPMGQYVTLDVTDVPAHHIATRMSQHGVRVAVTPAMADRMMTLKLDNVRGDLAVKRLAIELNAALYEQADGSWLIGESADVEASHPDARRVAPLADPTPTPTATPVSDP